jgi:hypothetical protein
MIRKLILPALAAALLAGCVTDYAYRGGSGDYYYGQPGSQYDYYGPYGGYYDGYGGYGGYGYPSYGWGGSFGFGYSTYPYFYGYPYYGHRRGHGHHGGGHHGGHDHDGDHHHGGDDSPQQQRPLPPWRDLGDLGNTGGKLPDPDARERGEAIPMRPTRPMLTQRPIGPQRPESRPIVTQRPVSRPIVRPPTPSVVMPRASHGDDDAGTSTLHVDGMVRRARH